MTTRRDTKKFEALLQNPQVALLVHDFDSLKLSQSSKTGTFSVTVYGSVSVLEGEIAEICRAHHKLANPSYGQFIDGEEIAILIIQPQYARICNVKDQVTVWSPTSTSTTTY
jgi:hypothetical protein